MSAELLEAARKEVERLKLVLSKNEDFQKLQVVLRLVDAYEFIDDKRTSGLQPTGVFPPTVTQTPPRPGSKVAAVDEAISKHLEKTGKRASSGDLLPVVLAAGVEMSGKVPAKTLSSFLTNSKRFNNVKGLGYGLVEWGDGAGPKADPLQAGVQRALAGFFPDPENNSGAGDDRS